MIQLGSKGHFTSLWQIYLNGHGFPCGKVDGSFGPKSDQATKAFQKAHTLLEDGIVGAGTFRIASANDWEAPEGYPLMLADNYKKAGRSLFSISLILVHTMEVAEKSYMAFEIGQRFCDGASPYSPHFTIDDTDIIQNVLLKDIAFHASQANAKSIGLEHAGFAGQTAEQWADPFSEKMLRRSARLTADLCRRTGIPAVWLTSAQIANGDRGISGHKQSNDANGGGGHYDPGPHWPAEHYIDLVQEAM